MIGVALLLVWPFAWRMAAYLADVETRVYNESLYQSGALLALATYALLWAPWGWISAAATAPVALSALIAFLLLKLKPSEAAKLWVWQISVAALVAALVIVGRHGLAMVFEATKIAAYAHEADPREVYKGTLAAPGEISVQWKSTGSPWLDRAAGQIKLTIEPAPHERRILLETLRGDETLSFKPIQDAVHTETLENIRPGTPRSEERRVGKECRL